VPLIEIRNLRANGNLVVAQSGGPTPVINASLTGVLLTARERGLPVLGARFGFEGLLAQDYIDLTSLSARRLAVLARTPAAALGSSRYRPTEAEIDRVVRDLEEREVRWLVMIGGNDSADVMHRIHQAAAARGQSLAVVGVPKTVDNDLPGMDHTPGYGSAARAVALFVRGTALDTSSMRRTDPVKIVEVAGRNSGWLAAGATLGRQHPEDAPQVVFLPERPRSLDHMVDEIKAALDRAGHAVVVICENQHDQSGAPLAGSEAVRTDPYGHAYHESPGQALIGAVRERLGVVARYERPGSMLRSLSGAQSKTDLEEAEGAGVEAAWLALAGASDIMVAIQREPSVEYRVRFDTVSLTSVAGQERLLPDAFIAASGTDVTPAFLDYARPLIGSPLPAILRLD
jgi:6-phosphofructokinase 1